MLLTVKVKLLPNSEQKQQLLATMEAFNKACDMVSVDAFACRCFNKFAIQAKLYRRIREEFRLSAQLTVRCISKVVESYQTDIMNIRERNKRKAPDMPKEELVVHTFRPHSAMVYDQRILSWKGLDNVSITSLDGRLIIPTVVRGKYAPLEMSRVKGQADLIYIDGRFYLCVIVDVPEEAPITPDGYLGIDLGVVNLAVDSDGNTYEGKRVEESRQKYGLLKAKLQGVGTKSAKKHLVKVSKKESKFKADENHRISKAVVSLAKGTGRGIALEELTHINARSTVMKAQRDSRSKWAFSQLRKFIAYKAALAGVPLVIIDPRNTSRQCSACGHIDEKNRPTRSDFCCVSCGHSENADLNAAKNIRNRAAIIQPMVVRRAGEAA